MHGVAALLLLAVLPGVARAHQGGISYADIDIREREVEITLAVAYQDWLPVVDLDADHDGVVTSAEARAGVGRLGLFARSRLTVTADGRSCAGEARDADVAERLGTTFVVLRLVYTCPSPVSRLRIACALLSREHAGHRTLARIEDRSGRGMPLREHVFGPGSEKLEVAFDRRTQGPLAAAAEFLRLGVEHIFTGYDHILFLLGLLLVARGFADLLKIVTAFTVAHTLTLVLATLRYLSLDVRLVESVIALSIAYVALENLVAAEHRRRWVLAFVFGLVHGFGFSNVLRAMDIPRQLLAWSLASFNIGVEIGQVVIVSLCYPVLVWSRRRPWNLWAVRAASVVIGLMGLYWFVERALLAA